MILVSLIVSQKEKKDSFQEAVKFPTNCSACLFELQLNEKQLELVGSEKQLELDGWLNVKMLFDSLLLGRLVHAAGGECLKYPMLKMM